MKIVQWLGYNEDASQYILRPGELRVLNNLQARRPGMLVSRKGLVKLYGKYDDEAIFGLYRRAVTFGNPADYLWLQKVLVPRILTADEISALESPYKYVWMVKRVLGNEYRVIDTQDISPDGKTSISNFCVAEDRHGRMFIFYGHGVRPRLYRPTDMSNVAVDMGLDPPLAAPSVIASGSGYFIESVDVKSGGGSYYAPPELSITGGNPERQAQLSAIVQSGNVVGVDIIDGGSNYQSTPQIAVAMDKIGTGFRARGNISNSARTIEGFADSDAGTVTGTAASSTETYGSTNGTSSNSILYLSQPSAKTVKVVGTTSVSGTYSQTGTTLTVTTSAPHRLATGQSAFLDFTSGSAVDASFTVTVTGENTFTVQRSSASTSGNVTVGATALTLDSVDGILVGDIVAVYPEQAPFNNSTVTVTAIDSSSSRVTLSSNTFFPAAGTAYEATFSRSATVAQAKADYDPSTRRFYASIPVSSSSSGRGAYATLQFSPKPLGYGLNAASSSSISLTNNNFQTYINTYSKGKKKEYTPYLYNEYWQGSDYDIQKSKENSGYGGLQASGSSFVRGYSGSVGGRAASVYWPDYSKISVWFCTGVYSGNANQWSRADVEVKQEAIPGTSPVQYAKYIEFSLKPTQQAKTVKSLAGSLISTDYKSYDGLPDAVAPKVKLYLTQCPDSWIVSGTDCLPTEKKEAESNRLAWWSSGSLVPRPFVGITPTGTPVSSSAVTITDAGKGWASGTVFAFRLYQANPYTQYVDYNTAQTGATVQKSHDFYEQNNRYVEFKLTADTPDNSTPHGPPNVLITPSAITIPGDGYSSGQTGKVTLYKRGLTSDVSSASQAQTIQWTAKILDTLSASSTGSITSISILSKGQNYLAPPTIQVRGGGGGYGLSVQPSIDSGRISSVQILDPGVGYTIPPELYTTSSAAQLTPVMRPTMRGAYRCAYRFADRSDTIIATVSATLGNSATTLTLSDATGVEPDMILDSPSLPFNAKVKSVNGNQVEINQKITDLAADTPINVIVRDMSKPVAYSDFSPITDVDAGQNSAVLTWSLPGVTPPPRADLVEFWRTSADESLVFYRVEARGIPTTNGVAITGADTLTDEQLFDPSRPFYAAMPVVLPNGNVNAYRFGKPRSDMSVAVAFQDRLWMGVSTSGKDANTIYYSEFDEFESTPDVNDLPIQINQKSTDVLTALVPFGTMLLAMQHTHTYAIQYNTDPGVDASVQMLNHRGCLHQRCWDIHDSVLYAADESGIYAMMRNGQVKDISTPIRTFFVSELIDFSKRETFFLQADPRTHILRFFCTLKSSPTDTPSLALCFDIQAGTWWTESYPNSLTAACTGRPGVTRINTIVVGGVDGNLYEMSGDSDHANECLTDCFVSEGGSGYREAPTISVPNCEGAVVKGVVSEGRLVDVIIQSPGWNARGGLELATESGAPLASHDGRVLGGVEYWPINLIIGPPEPGGIQAVAYANFAVTPRIVRSCTVTKGESFVRIDPSQTTQVSREDNPPIASESHSIITTEDGLPISIEPPPVEVGMEASGDFIPLNAFVSRIDGKDVYLQHPDGTPVSMLFGVERYNQTGTSTNYLELGGTPMTVTFRKPYRTNIPFRMVTGFMQLINEDFDKRGDSLIDRSITLVYTPTEGDKEIELIERFNGREEMRPNLIRRDRTGASSFVHRQDSASTVLNMNRRDSHSGFSTGVATARFASRVYTDMTGEDQHLQVELCGRPTQASQWARTNFWIPDADIKPPQPVVMHSLTVEGVVENAQ